MPTAPSGPPINPFPKEPLENADKPRDVEEVEFDPTLPDPDEDEEEDKASV